jgi:hypothetical protein
MIKFQRILMQALAIDEKIGYPEYLGSDNVTELENDYVEVRPTTNTKIFIHCKFDYSINSIHRIFIIS